MAEGNDRIPDVMISKGSVFLVLHSQIIYGIKIRLVSGFSLRHSSQL